MKLKSLFLINQKDKMQKVILTILLKGLLIQNTIKMDLTKCLFLSYIEKFPETHNIAVLKSIYS